MTAGTQAAAAKWFAENFQDYDSPVKMAGLASWLGVSLVQSLEFGVDDGQEILSRIAQIILVLLAMAESFGEVSLGRCAREFGILPPEFLTPSQIAGAALIQLTVTLGSLTKDPTFLPVRVVGEAAACLDELSLRLGSTAFAEVDKLLPRHKSDQTH